MMRYGFALDLVGFLLITVMLLVFGGMLR
jgi:hypothetical protein